eukprot:INCI18280.1.p1 GENE.INCI18280.1~~INCI18280.1.p1  ORF type:complete len:169 (+),score=31.62 INCI18280.1:146-652(+)
MASEHTTKRITEQSQAQHATSALGGSSEDNLQGAATAGSEVTSSRNPLDTEDASAIPVLGVTVIIQHCKASGFASKAVDASLRIRRVFGNSVVVKTVPDKGVTANFEIFVNGKLLHSKQTLNEGFLDNAYKCEKLFRSIVEAGGVQVERRQKALSSQRMDAACQCSMM